MGCRRLWKHIQEVSKQGLGFYIRFVGDELTESGDAVGKILLGGSVEIFESPLGPFSRHRYESQWREALHLAVNFRCLSCLITELYLDSASNGYISYFTLIPSELARGSKEHGSETTGFYITQSIWQVTSKPENMMRVERITLEDSTDLGEAAVYYFDPERPQRIFAFLQESVSNISNWFVPNDWLVTALKDVSAP